MARKRKKPAKPASTAAATPPAKTATVDKLTKKPGRPAGSKNLEYDRTVAQPVACKRCGSTERSPYFGSREVAFESFKCDRVECGNMGAEGSPCSCGGQFTIAFNTIAIRRTRCLQCQQARTERHFEMREASQATKKTRRRPATR